jgi:hypothetical protein
VVFMIDLPKSVVGSALCERHATRAGDRTPLARLASGRPESNRPAAGPGPYPAAATRGIGRTALAPLDSGRANSRSYREL